MLKLAMLDCNYQQDWEVYFENAIGYRLLVILFKM